MSWPIVVDIVYEMLFLNLAQYIYITSIQKVLGSNPVNQDIFNIAIATKQICLIVYKITFSFCCG